MNDELSDDIKKKLMLPLMIDLQDRKEKVFHKTPVSPIPYTIYDHNMSNQFHKGNKNFVTMY